MLKAIKQHVGFGCVHLSMMPTLRSALSLLETAYENGITYFDTAPIYGSGYSEKIVGKFIKNKRQHITVTTKFGLLPHIQRNIPPWIALPLKHLKKKHQTESQSESGNIIPDVIPFRRIECKEIKTAFQKSLVNLKTDYIDNYLLHEALPAFLSDEAMNYIFDLKKKGFVRKIGIAASYVNLYQLAPETITNWDILQYENGLLFTSDDILQIFPGKRHIYHSILKKLKTIKIDGYSKNEIAGILLARALKNNPAGQVLFSTSKNENIKEDLKNLEKFQHLSLNDLNNTIVDAIY